MCRWLAYLGSPIFIDTLLLDPVHSLIDQSRDAELSEYRTNGDGFGVGWYGEHTIPGVYRNVRPAWNDANLKSLAKQIRSGHFMAHVRTTTGTAIQASNCHPFPYENWLFQHNGEINGFEKVKKELDCSIADKFYPLMQGSTDSERLFYLALTYGLQKDPRLALAKTVGKVESLREKYEIEEAFRFTAAVSDGKNIYAVRYASQGESNSLYHNKNIKALQEVCQKSHEVPHDGQVILSEPLDRVSEHWEEVPDRSFMVAGHEQNVKIESFEPEPC